MEFRYSCDNKRYHTWNYHLRQRFGCKVMKLALNGGFTCPGRDGTLGTRGCIFCSEGGSGEFAAEPVPLKEQLEQAKARIQAKTNAEKFIAYFQSFTNTYGDPRRLRKLYTEAILREEVVVLSLGTRPDCLPEEILKMLRELNEIKPVWVELGLQTIHERTAAAFGRGYTLDVFEEANRRLKNAGVSVIVHVILGLPGESREDMLDTVRYLAGTEPRIDGIKLQLLQVLKGTRLGEEYLKQPFPLMTMEEYTDLVAESIRLLPEETVIHRMTGDGPRKLLIAPEWTLHKKTVLNTINRKLKERTESRI